MYNNSSSPTGVVVSYTVPENTDCQDTPDYNNSAGVAVSHTAPETTDCDVTQQLIHDVGSTNISDLENEISAPMDINNDHENAENFKESVSMETSNVMNTQNDATQQCLNQNEACEEESVLVHDNSSKPLNEMPFNIQNENGGDESATCDVTPENEQVQNIDHGIDSEIKDVFPASESMDINNGRLDENIIEKNKSNDSEMSCDVLVISDSPDGAPADNDQCQNMDESDQCPNMPTLSKMGSIDEASEDLKSSAEIGLTDDSTQFDNGELSSSLTGDLHDNLLSTTPLSIQKLCDDDTSVSDDLLLSPDQTLTIEPLPSSTSTDDTDYVLQGFGQDESFLSGNNDELEELSHSDEKENSSTVMQSSSDSTTTQSNSSAVATSSVSSVSGKVIPRPVNSNFVRRNPTSLTHKHGNPLHMSPGSYLGRAVPSAVAINRGNTSSVIASSMLGRALQQSSVINARAQMLNTSMASRMPVAGMQGVMASQTQQIVGGAGGQTMIGTRSQTQQIVGGVGGQTMIGSRSQTQQIISGTSGQTMIGSRSQSIVRTQGVVGTPTQNANITNQTVVVQNQQNTMLNVGQGYMNTNVRYKITQQKSYTSTSQVYGSNRGPSPVIIPPYMVRYRRYGNAHPFRGR
ncbi:hypothetical protein KUTeg_006804 [Tegillarca granosa]|uniref:Uncharacterized protein n=1 Tax=Tegillarca granosa TaxID=220873 RepID=A0ABQ9FBD4_TEGGR|nr:hypothetical protein KUTeg_006804 [Tegillarca granosa]